MPNNVREPDMTSEERDALRRYAQGILDGSYPPFDRLMARAVLRYVPAGVPVPAPHLVAESSDKTMPAGVICEPIAEESSGVVEPSDDGETRRVGDLGLTRAIDISGDGDTRR